MKSILPGSTIPLLLALTLSGCGGGGSPSSENLHQGKTFAAWLAQVQDGRGEARLQAVRAVGAMASEEKGGARREPCRP